MFVNSIISEAKEILGKCDTSVVYRRLTDAVRLANNQAKGNDWNVGQMDICVCNGTVTLPADVATVLGVNRDGQPTLLRDQWFQYHANGPGTQDYASWSYTDELGSFSTFRDPAGPVKLVAVVENAMDSNTELRVYGWDENGKRIYTRGPNDTLEDGLLVPTVYGFALANPEAPSIARIDRIQKASTNGFIKLIAVDPTSLEAQTTIGYYQPWETAPLYRRIRVPDRSWIRIKYRKKDIEVRGLNDWINLDNREALLLLLKAVSLRLNGQVEQARNYELEGMRLLSNEAESLQPPGISPPQVIFNLGLESDSDDTLFG